MFTGGEIKTGHLQTAFLFNSNENEEGGNDSLEDAVKDEQEYLRERLRDELKREPTEAELDEWQRRHTEGY